MMKTAMTKITLIGALTLFTASTHLCADNLHYGESRAPDTLDPYTSNESTSLRISQLIFNGLVGINEKQEVVPELATQWQVSEDRTIYIFSLREDVFWHSHKDKQQPFTANDIVSTFNVMTHPKTRSNRKALFDHIEKIEALGNHKVQITLKRVGLNDLSRFNFKILPAHLFNKQAFLTKSHSLAHQPIGTGPYRYTKSNNKLKVILESNPDYFLGEPKLKQISLKPFSDDNMMNQALSFNALDMVINVPPRHLADLQDDKRFSLAAVNTLSYSFFAYNMHNPHLQKQKVRKALSLALNREQMLKAFFGDRGTIISGPFPPGSWAYNLDVIPDQYNPEKAEAMLQEAGYAKSGAYFVTKNREPLAFKLSVPIEKNNESTKRVVLAYENFLKKIGVKINVDFMEREDWRKQVFKKHNFDITLTAWSFDDASDISTLFHSRFNGPWENNFISYANKNIDSLIELGSTTVDFEEKRTIYHQIHEILAEESPYTFLWSLLNYTAYNNKFKDVSIHPYKTFDNIQLWRTE